jgi:hypothetical protein
MATPVDLVAGIPLAEARRRLVENGVNAILKRGVLQGGFPCVKGDLDGVEFDVLPPLVPVVVAERCGSSALRAGRSSRWWTSETLIPLKLRPQRGAGDSMDRSTRGFRHLKIFDIF